MSTAALRQRFRCNIAGLHYHCNLILLRKLQVDDELKLEREYDNRYDRFAVKVSWKDLHIGYVPRADAVAVAPLLDAGWMVEARIHEIHPATVPAAWIVVFEILGQEPQS